MPFGFKRFSGSAAAFPTLLASSWKARSPFVSAVINATSARNAPYTSIADAMLGRAVQNYESLPQAKKPAPSQLSSSPAALAGKLAKTAKPAQSSLMGFTKPASSNILKHSNSSRSSSQSGSLPGNDDAAGKKRLHPGTGGLVAALNKTDSFQDMSDTVDSTKSTEFPIKTSPSSSIPFVFDPNDFEDDAELDLDMQYPLPLPSADAARGPLLPVSTNLSQSHTPLGAIASSTKSADPPSSMTWSSSPLSHKVTPPGAAKRRQLVPEMRPPTMPSVSISNSSVDANPRPAKRRTVPWLEREADRRREEIENGTSETRSQDVSQKTTPSSKERALPWNTTHSAMKYQQRHFKDQKRREAKEKDDVSYEDMQDAIATTTTSRPSPICLSDEQTDVLNLVTKKNKSVFFTGSAGTGKSVLMRSIIGELRKIYAKEPDRVAVTASTGLAACNIGGVTLHSFAGIGLGKESADELKKKVSRHQKAKQRWIRTKVLIIDEISMVDGDLFDKLETVARFIRKNGRPFGGIQIVVTGDFFQLPPVPDYGQRGAKFAFDAGTWSTVIHHTIRLTEVFRQRDPVFANMLNEMRVGKITDETVKAFKKLERPIGHEDALEATELFPTRNEVDSANAFKMRNLQGKSYMFKAVDSGTLKDIEQRNRLLQNCMAPPVLELKKGAQVMLIKNIDENLVNGSLGTVIAFMNEKNFEIYDQDQQITDAEHPDEVEANSKFREAKKKLTQMLNKDLIADTGNLYPLVRFRIADGTSRDLLCQPEDWKVELPNGEVQAQRSQVPLILAWALSIHKAQGQTMSLVKVDLKRTFEKGQAYVALSRATSQEGLCVLNFNKKAVMAHPRVAEFYNSLYSVNDAIQKPKSARVVALKQEGKATEKLFPNTGRAQVAAGLEFGDEEEAMAAYG